jgi:hypothetical protein
MRPFTPPQLPVSQLQQKTVVEPKMTAFWLPSQKPLHGFQILADNLSIIYNGKIYLPCLRMPKVRVLVCVQGWEVIKILL